MYWEVGVGGSGCLDRPERMKRRGERMREEERRKEAKGEESCTVEFRTISEIKE